MTPEQRAVLEHVVLDADGWYAHVITTFGEERAAQMLAAKLARWSADYARESAKPDYTKRADRAHERSRQASDSRAG